MTARGRRSALVESYLRRHCFTNGARDDAPPASWRFGAELELIALSALDGSVAPIVDAGDGRATLAVVRRAAARFGWAEQRSAKGASRFVACSGAALTFEPGGQIEYASSVHRSIDALAVELRTVHATLCQLAAEHGISLLAVGVDPVNDADTAPLQLDAERYRRMAAYFATIGPDGARMMRQTASLQLCIGGVDVCTAWRTANALAPWLVALFANSSRYARRDTGCVSYRAETWRGVDPHRTGVLSGDDPVREYTAFALDAPAFLAGEASLSPVAFVDLPDEHVTHAAIATHLSTLFPEVRPRGYLELRSIDAIGEGPRLAALVLAAGLLCDATARDAAYEIAGAPSPSLLWSAGRQGLAHPRLARSAGDLVDLALKGCARLGESVVSPAAIDAASDYFGALLGDSSRRASTQAALR